MVKSSPCGKNLGERSRAHVPSCLIYWLVCTRWRCIDEFMRTKHLSVLILQSTSELVVRLVKLNGFCPSSICLLIVPRRCFFQLLSYQLRVTVMSCFVYKVIWDLESIDHLCINPFRRIWLIHKWSLDPRTPKWTVQVNVLLNNCKQILHHCHLWLARQYIVCFLMPLIICTYLVHILLACQSKMTI